MPAKSIYVKDADLCLWEKAQKLGVNVSALVSDCVRKKLINAESTNAERMGRITVVLWNHRGEPLRRVGFGGRWLLGNSETGFRSSAALAAARRDTDREAEWSVALTAKGRIAVYRHR